MSEINVGESQALTLSKKKGGNEKVPVVGDGSACSYTQSKTSSDF